MMALLAPIVDSKRVVLDKNNASINFTIPEGVAPNGIFISIKDARTGELIGDNYMLREGIDTEIDVFMLDVYKSHTIQLAFYSGAPEQPYDTWYKTNSESVSAWSAPVQVVLVGAGSITLTSTGSSTLTWSLAQVDINGDPIVTTQFKIIADAEQIEESPVIYGSAPTWTTVKDYRAAFGYKEIKAVAVYTTEHGYTASIESGAITKPEFASVDDENQPITISTPIINPIKGQTVVYFGNGILRRRPKHALKGFEEILSESSPYTDMTLEPGVPYLYCCGEATQSVCLILDDMFLLNSTGKMCIKYNPDISSYKYTVSDSVLMPLGAQYPVVRRNGYQKYRQFNIGGLISYYAEQVGSLGESNSSVMAIDSVDSTKGTNNTAINWQEGTLYNVSYQSYADDAVRERQYRDAILNYLYDDKPKLFRSTTEGNILVRLSNVSFTPNKQLGRTIYSFTATCTEIAAPTIDNFKKYEIVI